MNKVIEVCAGSYQDCLAAAQGGATRVELNSALSVGGLTPSVATLQLVKEATNLSVICMVRPRAAGFCYDEQEKKVMFQEAKSLLEAGADGIAFGFLNKDGSIDIAATTKMVDLIHSFKKEAVFHRAFDVCNDPMQAIDCLMDCGVDRLLTSGMQAKAVEGKELIAKLQAYCQDKIELLAGSGVNVNNAVALMEETGIHQVHSSCKNYANDPTTSKGTVSYSYLEDEHRNDYDIVDVKLVEALVNALS